MRPPRMCKYYQAGNCRKGKGCTFSHDPLERPTGENARQRLPSKSHVRNSPQVENSSPISYDLYIEQSKALLASKELINGGNIFYFGAPKLDWQSFLFNKKFLDMQQISQRQAHDFVFACLASTTLPDNDILVNIAAPKGQKVGIQLLNLMLQADYTTNSVQAGSFVLNFQSVLAPLTSFLTHPSIVDSALHECSSAIINVSRKNLVLFLPKYLKCLESVTDAKRIIQDPNHFEQLFNCRAVNVFPISFEQLYLPIVRLIYIIITHFRDESFNKLMLNSIETLTNLVTKLEVTMICEASPNAFSMSVLNREMDRVCSISNMARVSLKMTELFLKEKPPPVIQTPNATDYWNTPIKSIPGQPAIHDNDFYDISDISIIPTMKEVTCGSTSALPGNYHELPNAHWLPQSPERLLDTQFRLLRHDLLGPLRDNALGCLEFIAHPNSKGHNIKNGRIRSHASSSNVDVYLYSNVKFRQFAIVKREFSIHVDFDQPSHLSSKQQRRHFWDSNRLQHGSLIGLVISGYGSRHVFFGTVHVDRNESDLINDRPSIRISFETNFDAQALTYLIRNSGPKDYSPHLLFENNNIMFESYRAVLRAIQNFNPLTFPFAGYLCYPKMNSTTVMQSPLYSQVPGFQLNLSFLTKGHNTALDPNSENSKFICVDQLQRYSTMDKCQAEALVSSISSQIGCIQGPPGMCMIKQGTGKSFVGTKIVQAMIQNKTKVSENSPILLICYTNHALDQFIEELLDSGVTDICRLGSRSNSERIQKLSLRNQDRTDRSIGSRRQEKTCIEKIEECEGLLNEINAKISYKLKWLELAPYLEMNNPAQFYSFDCMYQEMEIEKSEGWIKAGEESQLGLIDAWLKGCDLISLDFEEARSRPRNLQELLLVEDVYSMSKQERSIMLEYWKNEVPGSQYERAYHIADILAIAKKNLDNIRTSYDADALRSKQIIAATTTGAARYQDLIKALSPKIIVVEEAGEVLEAHILSALHPSVQQLILIGDHLQLRPQIADYTLSQESSQGKKYRLDMSLFERLQDPHYVVPMRTLSLQRRMRPEVSDLIRYTLYPKLEDHQRVKEYPQVPGFKENVFFISHDKAEDTASHSAYVNSHSNQYEVEYAISLLQFLLRNGAKATDCVILTPYVGQLMQLRNALKKEFTVQLEERDLKELEGFDDTLGENESTTCITADRVSLQNVIRVATIDNYQGEESTYVIISLVRSSSPKKSIGFLKTSNRINVLLSRAKHGMYMIGNDLLLRSHSEMWTNVLDILESRNQVGPYIELFCTQHPDYLKKISDPNDILVLFPDGGCSRKCTVKLPNCGHLCPFKCHSDFQSHVGITCIQECVRLHHPCQHPCDKRCHQDCGDCQVDVGDVQLLCGHISKNTKCHLAQNSNRIKCRVNVQRTVSKCNHSVTVPCCTDMETFKCKAFCNGQLGCQHKCTLKCSACDGENHEICQKKCEKPLACGHYCEEKCHANNPICPPCKSICSIWSCDHSSCNHECSKPCRPCQNPCLWTCEHENACDLICGAPCTRLPCDKRCTRALKCGHQCVSICGETCPDEKYCQVCAPDKIKTTIVDIILSQEYYEIDINETPVLVLGCGHFFTVETLDGLVDLQKAYKLDNNRFYCVELTGEFLQLPRCLTCRAPIRNIRRYGRILNHCSGQVSEKHFIVNTRADIREIYAMIEHFKSINFQENVALHQGSFRLHSSVLKALHPISKKLAQLKSNVWSSPRKYLYDSCVSFLLKTGNTRELSLSLPKPYYEFEREVVAIGINLESSIQDMFYLASISRTVPEEKTGLLAQYKTGMAQIFEKTRKYLETDTNSLAETSGCALMFFNLQIKLQFCSRNGEADEIAQIDRELNEFIAIALPSFIYANQSAIEEMKKKITNRGPFYQEVTEEEKRIVFQTMNAEFRGGGHWYQCPNGHIVY